MLRGREGKFIQLLIGKYINGKMVKSRKKTTLNLLYKTWGKEKHGQIWDASRVNTIFLFQWLRLVVIIKIGVSCLNSLIGAVVKEFLGHTPASVLRNWSWWCSEVREIKPNSATCKAYPFIVLSLWLLVWTILKYLCFQILDLLSDCCIFILLEFWNEKTMVLDFMILVKTLSLW